MRSSAKRTSTWLKSTPCAFATLSRRARTDAATFGPTVLSSDALQVRPHHVGHAADLGIAPDLIHRSLVAGTRVLECLQGHVEADLVPVLEAVSHRLRHTVDPQPDAIAFNFFDPCGEGLARELHHLDRRVVDPRWVAAAWHGDPDPARQLGGQLGKLPCGEQAEHGLWHLGG